MFTHMRASGNKISLSLQQQPTQADPTPLPIEFSGTFVLREASGSSNQATHQSLHRRMHCAFQGDVARRHRAPTSAQAAPTSTPPSSSWGSRSASSPSPPVLLSCSANSPPPLHPSTSQLRSTISKTALMQVFVMSALPASFLRAGMLPPLQRHLDPALFPLTAKCNKHSLFFPNTAFAMLHFAAFHN